MIVASVERVESKQADASASVQSSFALAETARAAIEASLRDSVSRLGSEIADTKASLVEKMQDRDQRIQEKQQDTSEAIKKLQDHEEAERKNLFDTLSALVGDKFKESEEKLNENEKTSMLAREALQADIRTLQTTSMPSIVALGLCTVLHSFLRALGQSSTENLETQLKNLQISHSEATSTSTALASQIEMLQTSLGAQEANTKNLLEQQKGEQSAAAAGLSQQIAELESVLQTTQKTQEEALRQSSDRTDTLERSLEAKIAELESRVASSSQSIESNHEVCCPYSIHTPSTST